MQKALGRFWPQRLSAIGYRLSARIVALSLGLLLAMQLSSLLLVQWSTNQNARSQLEARLEVGERIWTRPMLHRAASSGDFDTPRSVLDPSLAHAAHSVHSISGLDVLVLQKSPDGVERELLSTLPAGTGLQRLQRTGTHLSRSIEQANFARTGDSALRTVIVGSVDAAVAPYTALKASFRAPSSKCASTLAARHWPSTSWPAGTD